jgi:hypothetical protein
VDARKCANGAGERTWMAIGGEGPASMGARECMEMVGDEGSVGMSERRWAQGEMK